MESVTNASRLWHTLPLEVVHLVLEHAALMCNSVDAAFVAGLLRLSKAVSAIVTPLLYYTVVLDTQNFATFVDFVSLDSLPLIRNFCVKSAWETPSSADEDRLARRDARDMARAMAH